MVLEGKRAGVHVIVKRMHRIIWHRRHLQIVLFEFFHISALVLAQLVIAALDMHQVLGVVEGEALLVQGSEEGGQGAD